MFDSKLNRPFARTDNDLAINMLNCVAAILRAVEHDEAECINAALVGLKQDLKDFEQVFHENLIKGVYHQ